MMGEMIVRERMSSAAREEIAEELGVPPRGGRGRRWGGGGGRHRHRHHRRPFFVPIYRESFLEPYPVFYGQSVEEEVAARVRDNECFVLRWGGEPTRVRQAVIDALKARGWVERMDVRSRGGFNLKVLLLCPPPAEAVQPQSQPVAVQGLQPALMTVHDRRDATSIGSIHGLGQLNPQIRVLVTDRRGEPMDGIPVVVVPAPGVQASGVTDSDGAFIAPLSANTQAAIVRATLPEGESAQSVGVAQGYANTVVFRSIRKASGPIVTPLELGAGLGGIALFLLGHFALKSEPVKMVGEIGFIAAVFTRVGRA